MYRQSERLVSLQIRVGITYHDDITLPIGHRKLPFQVLPSLP